MKPRRWKVPEGELAEGVREYGEGYEVRIGIRDDVEPTAEPRLVIVALNEGGHCGTDVDLLDLLAWVKRTHPEWLA